MATEISGSGRPRRRGWRAFFQVIGIAALLLATSEAVWLWQTWPVRELLFQPTTGTHSGLPR